MQPTSSNAPPRRARTLFIVAASVLIGMIVGKAMGADVSAVGMNTERPQPHTPAWPTIDALKTAESKADGYVWMENIPNTRGVYTVVTASGTTRKVDAPNGPWRKPTDAVQLLRPGYNSTAGTFTTKYLESKKPFGVVRLMNWMSTNDVTSVTSWASRPKPSDRYWSDKSKGAPVEPWIEWAEQTSKPLWFCIPHTANDDYVAGLAKACAAAGIVAYVEHSNEVWNTATVAGGKSGVPALAAKAGLPLQRYHLRRTLQIGRIFRQHMPAERVRVVYGAQFRDRDAARAALAAEKPGKGELYAIAIAPYQSDAGGATSTRPQDHADAYLKKAQDWLAGRNSDSVAGIKSWKTFAKDNGVKLVAYECGLDPQVGDTHDARNAARAKAQDLPDTGQAVSTYLDALFKHGIDEAVFYKDFGLWNKGGFYGLSADPNKVDGPKYMAAKSAAARYRMTVPDRPDDPATRPTTQPTTNPAWMARLEAIEAELPDVRADTAAATAKAADATARVKAMEAEIVKLRDELDGE